MITSRIGLCFGRVRYAAAVSLVAGLAAVLAAAALPAAAAGPWELYGSVGADYWHVDWKRAGFETTTAGVWGPRGVIGYGPLSLSVGYAVGDFDAPEYDGSWDRTDLDFTLSYSIIRYLSAFAGYKRVVSELRAGAFRQEETYTSPALGLAFYAPFGDLPLFGYGSGSYMIVPTMERKTSETDEVDAEGYNLEAGVGYSVAAIRTTFLAGYRYNELKPERSSEVFFDNDFSGLIVGASYRIR